MTNTSNNQEQSQSSERSDRASWAPRVSTITVGDVPDGALNLNLDGRRLVGPLQGFGQLWQKTYRVRLSGADVTPAEVIRVWKEHFPEFHPPQNRFFPSAARFAPGAVVLINATLQGLPIDAGVVVLYADDESFTVMTPEGFPESGWNTFSAFEENGVTVAQVQSLARANDPIYELGFRVIGARAQEQIWTHVLMHLAAYFGVEAQVELHKLCLDPKLQWREARNVWHNAGIRTVLYSVSMPLRWVRGRFRR